MSTSTTSGDGDKKPPDSLIKGQEALERLRRAHVTEPPKEEAKPIKSFRPSITHPYDKKRSDEDPAKSVRPGFGERKLTEKDRITLWVRLVSRIPKHLADKHNAEVDAELARQQASSGSGDISNDRSVSGNNQSTKNRPSKKLLGQCIKLQLETFQLWLRKRISMAAPTSGNPAPAPGAPATPAGPAQAAPAPAAPAATAQTAPAAAPTPTGNPAAQSGTTTGTTGTGGTSASGTGQNTGGPVQNAPTAQAAPAPATPTAAPYVVYPPQAPWWNYSLAIVALVAVTLGLCFYVYRDQNVVHETQRAFETQSTAQAEKARATEEIERARSLQIRAYDEVNQLKQEVEGIRRQTLQIPPPVFQTIPPTQPGTVPTPSQVPAQLAPDTKESGSSHTVTNNITVVHRVEVRHENPALTIVPNGYWSPTPVINRYGYQQQGFNGFYYQYGW